MKQNLVIDCKICREMIYKYDASSGGWLKLFSMFLQLLVSAAFKWPWILKSVFIHSIWKYILLVYNKKK